MTIQLTDRAGFSKTVTASDQVCCGAPRRGPTRRDVAELQLWEAKVWGNVDPDTSIFRASGSASVDALTPHIKVLKCFRDSSVLFPLLSCFSSFIQYDTVSYFLLNIRVSMAAHQEQYGSDLAEAESGGINKEKPTTFALDETEDIHALAERGHVATDQYVSPKSPLNS